MTSDTSQGGLQLTEDEAMALLGLCMTSPLVLDPKSEMALRKLAKYCKSHLSHGTVDFHKPISEPYAECELSKVGA